MFKGVFNNLGVGGSGETRGDGERGSIRGIVEESSSLRRKKRRHSIFSCFLKEDGIIFLFDLL